MKRVLITGANSFLGNNTKKYLEEHGDYQVDILDMLDENWCKTDFSKYEVVFNVCAIVHRPKENNADLYYKINRDLAVKIAKKAKAEGVKQFIQTSTNGVFGVDVGVMSKKNGFHPRTPYEKSKYEADCLLEELRDNSFKVCIVRPPLMYGKGCKGNFPKLEKFALKFLFFPSLQNKRDFIYVLNMSDFVRFAIENELDEVCYPRDAEPISTSNMVKMISDLNGKRIRLWAIFNPFVKLLRNCSRKLKLVFGDCYCIIDICSKEWSIPFNCQTALKDLYKKNEYNQ